MLVKSYNSLEQINSNFVKEFSKYYQEYNFVCHWQNAKQTLNRQFLIPTDQKQLQQMLSQSKPEENLIPAR